MADISQINLPNGSTYNVKDASALHNITVPEYDATQTYNVGDFVTYNGDIYMCIIYIVEPESWNSEHWRLVDVDQAYLHSLNPKGAGSFSLNRKANTQIGTCSFAEGFKGTASGKYSHAEGSNTTASYTGSHAEGFATTASGAEAHAEGSNTTASGTTSHAEGYNTTASGNYSHTEGRNTTASGANSHAEGYSSIASGNYSHTEGQDTIASGIYSHTEGYHTSANHRSQHVFGEYNVLDDSAATSTQQGKYVEIVGNGEAEDARSNARTLDWSGNEVLAGRLKVNGTQDVPIIYEVTQSQYDTLKQAGTLVHNALYVITDSQNLNCTAEDIEYSTGVDVKTKIDSKADTSSLATVATSGRYTDLSNKPIVFRGTLGLDVLQVMKDLSNDSICCYADSNSPPNQPTGHPWGSYFMYKTGDAARAYYTDNECFAVSNRITSSSTSITWKIFT